MACSAAVAARSSTASVDRGAQGIGALASERCPRCPTTSCSRGGGSARLIPPRPTWCRDRARRESSTHRNWVMLGTVGGAERAVIDPRGAVTPWPDGWSLDWWVGADDTWHLPSSAAGVRQRLVDDAPVVETVARIPGGEMIHRTWTVAAGAGVPDGGAVVIEMENASPVPVAVAVAVRPFNPLGRSAVSAITLDDTVVSIDGRPAVILPKQPSRFAVGSADVDAVVPTVAGDAVSTWPEGGARLQQRQGVGRVPVPAAPHRDGSGAGAARRRPAGCRTPSRRRRPGGRSAVGARRRSRRLGLGGADPPGAPDRAARAATRRGARRRPAVRPAPHGR